MSNLAPTLQDVKDNLPSIKKGVDVLFDALESISPDALKGTEEEVRLIVQAALSGIDLPVLENALASVAIVVAAGRGVVGGGAGSELA